MKVLYVLWPKAAPDSWATSGDTQIGLQLAQRMAPQCELTVFADFSASRPKFPDINLLDSSPFLTTRHFWKKSIEFIATIADQYDILQFHTGSVPTGHLNSKLSNRKVVLTWHTPPDVGPSFGFHGREDNLQFLNNPNFRFVSPSYTHANRVASALKVTRTSIPGLVTIMNGINEQPHPSKRPRRGGIVVGRLDPSKNILESLRLARHLTPEDESVLYLGGVPRNIKVNEPYVAQVTEFCESTSGVRWIGQVPNDSARSFLAEARVNFNLSKIETSPLNVIEATMEGTPTLGSKLNGVGEIIEPGVNGFHVDWKWRSVNNPEQKTRLADCYKQACALSNESIQLYGLQNYSLEDCVQKYLALYEELLSGN